MEVKCEKNWDEKQIQDFTPREENFMDFSAECQMPNNR